MQMIASSNSGPKARRSWVLRPRESCHSAQQRGIAKKIELSCKDSRERGDSLSRERSSANEIVKMVVVANESETDMNQSQEHGDSGVVWPGSTALVGAATGYYPTPVLRDESAEACNSRGTCRYASGDADGALAEFNRALTLKPNYAEATNNRGILRHSTRQFEFAIQDFDLAIQAEPGFAQAHNNRGVARQALGDLAGALADFENAVRLAPDYVDALNNRGLARLSGGDIVGALNDYAQALKLARGPEAAPVYHNRGAARQSFGDHAGAIADFDQALRHNPNQAGSYHNRGCSRRALGDLTGALADFETALERTPAPIAAPIYHSRGGVFVSQGRLTSALADYDQALTLDPLFWVAYISRANARYHKRLVGGFEDYRRAIAIEPPAAAREIVRLIAEHIEHGSKAVITNCEKHLQLDPNDLTAYARRGLTLLLLARDEDARRDFEAVVHLCPDCDRDLGLIIQAAHQYREARFQSKPSWDVAHACQLLLTDREDN